MICLTCKHRNKLDDFNFSSIYASLVEKHKMCKIGMSPINNECCMYLKEEKNDRNKH